MKQNLKVLIIAAFLTTSPLLMFAQPHPNGGAAPTGLTNTPVGPSAPIGSGTFILLTLAAAYAGRKVYVVRTETSEV
jgi:hypothetical protein